MVEWIPYLLVVFGLNPNGAGAPEVKLRKVAASIEACRMAGEAVVTVLSDDDQPQHYYLCLELPSEEEIVMSTGPERR